MTHLATDIGFFQLLASSYLHLTGRPLPVPHDAPGEAARWLYEEAPFGLVAHNTEADPRIIYANRTAQRWFEYSWEEMTAMCSRLTVSAALRAERERMLQSVRMHGFVDNYRSIRVARSGRQFWIERVTVWNLLDGQGACEGQAALYFQGVSVL